MILHILSGLAGVLAASVLGTMHRHYRRPPVDQLVETPRDAALAAWARSMHITVVNVNGATFETSLADLAVSEAAGFRMWNVPMAVTLWDDRESWPTPATFETMGEALKRVKRG